jgi:hypothetical protein
MPNDDQGEEFTVRHASGETRRMRGFYSGTRILIRWPLSGLVPFTREGEGLAAAKGWRIVFARVPLDGL